MLEGDVQALKLIDLEANGLGHLRGRLSGVAASAGDLNASSLIAGASSGAAAYESAASASYESASASYGGAYEAEASYDHNQY